MKKLLALLVAMFLPCCVIAETQMLSVHLDADEALLSDYVKQLFQSIEVADEEKLDLLIHETIQCINGMGFELSFQEDALALKVNLGFGELLDVTLHTDEDSFCLTSPMLSDYALWDALDADVWPSVFDGMGAVLDAWLADVDMLETQGVFHGDAYTGGTRCTTWFLTDADIAALISALATEEVRSGLISVLENVFPDAAALLNEFDDLNDRIAAEDAYQYLLRWVTDESGAFVGMSLTILKDAIQIATLSLGKTSTEVKVVLGLGMNEENYWWALETKQNQQQNIIYVSGESREWIADKDESFSYVSVADAPLSSHILRATVTESGSRRLWDGYISTDEESEYLLSAAGSYGTENGTLDCKISLGNESNEFIELTIRYGAAEPIAALDSTLKLCSLSDAADAALCQELLDKFAANLIARLIKLLPMDSMMTLNEFSLPQ